MDDLIDLKVSSKHLKTRIFIFVLAFLLAIFSFSYGVYSISKKEPGIYEIEAIRNDDVKFYNSGIKLYYYLEGNSNQIKSNLESISNLYSNSLVNIHCLLNNKNTYENYKNIAYINKHLNEDITLDETLFNIILDAYDKTLQNNGYNMFAGPLFESWNSILNSFEQASYEPINNPFEKERIETITELINEPNNISIDVIDHNKRIIRVNVSKEIIDVLNKYEYEYGLIDLNLLKDAYIAQFLNEELNKYEFTDGYIQFDSGLLMNMSSRDFGVYYLYTYSDAPSKITEINVDNRICISCFKQFSLGEDNYYEINDILRSPFISSKTGYPFVSYLSSYIYSSNNSPVELVYNNIVLNEMNAIKDYNYVYTMKDKTIYTNCNLDFNKDYKIINP